MPSVGFQEVGVFLGCLAALAVLVAAALSILSQWRKLTKQDVPAPGTAYVTSAELDRVEKRLKDEIIRVDTDAKDKMDKLHLYCRERFHEMGNAITLVQTGIAAMPIKIRETVDAAIAPLFIKAETNAVNIAKLLARVLDGHGDHENKP